MKTRLEQIDPVVAAQEILIAQNETRLKERPVATAIGTHPGQEMRAAEASGELWGLATSIDIYNCNPETIRDADAIRRFVVELCDLIEMRRFGETLVVNFGEDERVAGYSMAQLIETSLISAHFANLTNAVYLDVFSCKLYDPDTVAEFARSYFGGSHFIKHVTPRV